MSEASNENVIKRMRFACWVTKSTKKQPECLTFIASTQQQPLRDRISIFSYTYIVSLVVVLIDT